MKTRWFLSRTDGIAIMAAAVVAVALLTSVFLADETTESVLTEESEATGKAAHGGSGAEGMPFGKPSDSGTRPVLHPETFDPNTADSVQLLRIGLQPWQVRAIYRYRSKGGTYHTVADFARVPGLTVGQYQQLKPYLRIVSSYQLASTLAETNTDNRALRDTTRYPEKLRTGQHIDLSQADTTLLQRVPGIGSYFAARIVAYRNRLGGYYSLDQLKEIDGLPLTVMPYLKLGQGVTAKLHVNDLSVAELSRHPYIGFYQAKTIVDHRRKYGHIKSMDDLKLYRDFPLPVREKLKHYVVF